MPSSLMSPMLWMQTPFNDEDAWTDFVGVHALWHKALSEATGTRWMLTDDLKAEGGPHEQMHREVGAALQQPVSEELGSFDLNNEASFQAFMFLHSAEHQRFREATGL
jgi:hypothetical protein